MEVEGRDWQVHGKIPMQSLIFSLSPSTGSLELSPSLSWVSTTHYTLTVYKSQVQLCLASFRPLLPSLQCSSLFLTEISTCMHLMWHVPQCAWICPSLQGYLPSPLIHAPFHYKSARFAQYSVRFGHYTCASLNSSLSCLLFPVEMNEPSLNTEMLTRSLGTKDKPYPPN